MPHPTLDASWKHWIATNISRGCTIDSMLTVMIQKGWDRDRALEAIRAEPEYEYQTPDWMNVSVLPCADGQRVSVLQAIEKPRILLLENVMTGEECDELIRRAGPRLAASTTVDRSTGKLTVVKERRSMSAYFRNNEDDFLMGINRRLAELMHIPLENGEDLQIVKYTKGGEYLPHFDYFPHTDPGSASQIANGGQRVATLIVYLNEVPRGGATSFPGINLRVVPRKGNGLYFHYYDAHGQCDKKTLHAGEPVEEGEKWIITKWMRAGKRI